MTPQQARARVTETFPQPFNRAKFLEFARNLLNKFDESKAALWNATYVKDAFSVEAVTRAFFNQSAALFGDINAALKKLAAKDKTLGDEFNKKNVSTVDFAKKLLGQIVFLYFLQKKGWLGVAKGQDWGTGVLDVFDRYNFTVNEAEPLEKEVAIDPEMLGKVFENLIEENRRKGLGSFYTPREIVHYMGQESLIKYLDTALNNRELTPLNANQDSKATAGEIRVPSRRFVHARLPNSL